MALRAPILSIAEQLRRLALQEDEVLGLLQAVGLNDADILSLLRTLISGQTTVESVELTSIKEVLLAVERVSFKLTAGINQLTQEIQGPPQGAGLHLALTLPDDGSQMASYVLVVDDSTGQAAVEVGPPAWSIDDTTGAFSVAAAADGLSGTVKVVAGTLEGSSTTLSVTTATSSDGSTPPIVDTDTITVVGGTPSSAQLTGTVVPTA